MRPTMLLLGVLAPLAFLACAAFGLPLWWAGIVLLPLALLRRDTRALARWIGLPAALLGALTLLTRAEWPLRVYPVLNNVAWLALFAWSLRHPPTVIERFARLSEPDLPPAGVAYTRRVTQAWCAFFVGNGLSALATGLWADSHTWALYNGGIAYVLMGLMFGGEWLIRRRVRSAHHG
ncbi:hypothetical protein [Chitiniphilus shinanonensis]|uniref:COG4648 family protein n=1 Tax=Chitiniphilus shinanonensis TaxID=553088 RepID=UPI003070E367